MMDFWQQMTDLFNRRPVGMYFNTEKLSNKILLYIRSAVNFMLLDGWERLYIQRFVPQLNRMYITIDDRVKVSQQEYIIFLSNIGLLEKSGVKEPIYYKFWYDAINRPEERAIILVQMFNMLKSEPSVFFTKSFYYFIKYFTLGVKKDEIFVIGNVLSLIIRQFDSPELQQIIYCRLWEIHRGNFSLSNGWTLEYQMNYEFVSRVFDNDEAEVKRLIEYFFPLLKFEMIEKCFRDSINNYYQCEYLSKEQSLEFHGNSLTDCMIEALRTNFWLMMCKNCSDQVIKNVLQFYFDKLSLESEIDQNSANPLSKKSSMKDLSSITNSSGETFLHLLIKNKKNESAKLFIDSQFFDRSDTASYISYAALYKNHKIIQALHEKQIDYRHSIRITEGRNKEQDWSPIV